MSKIHYVLLVDNSGSMYYHLPTTAQGINQVIAALKNSSVENDAKVSLTVACFSDDANVIEGYDAVSIANAKPLAAIPGGGGTQLYIGLNFVLDRLAKQVRPNDKVVINVFTDGQSANTQRDEATKACLALDGRYTLSFVAANQDARAVAATLGIPESNAMDYANNTNGFRGAFWKLAKAARQYVEGVVESWNSDHRGGFFDGIEDGTPLKVRDLQVTVNMPEAIRSEDEDKQNELPPYAPVKAYVVDEYPGCPDTWEHGSAKASSYFVPVRENTGMWFDFNDLSNHPHDIACVVSVQGVNPVTGQDAMEDLQLEKYETKCPKHDVEFGQDRYCDKCGFKWPAQNFLSTSAQPRGQNWLDGFRSGDGKVRQYIFTPEQMKGVAFNILDKGKPEEQHKRVRAVGVAFYRSKKAKPVVEIPTRYTYNGQVGSYSGVSGMGSGQRYTQNRIGDMFSSSVSSSSSGSVSSSGSSSSQFFSPAYTPQQWNRDKAALGHVVSRKGAVPDLATEEDIADLQANLEAVANDPNLTIVTHSAMSFTTQPDDHELVDEIQYPELIDGQVDRTAYSLAPRITKGEARWLAATGQERYYTLNGAYAGAAQKQPITPKNYEVGAGARIDQRVHDDTNPMDYWEEEPYAMLYLNYADETKVAEILAAGRRKEAAEGFLAEVPALGH